MARPEPGCSIVYVVELIGMILGVASTGVAIGPLLGGALTQHTSWRWCTFWVYISRILSSC